MLIFSQIYCKIIYFFPCHACVNELSKLFQLETESVRSSSQMRKATNVNEGYSFLRNHGNKLYSVTK